MHYAKKFITWYIHFVNLNAPRDWFETNSRHEKRHFKAGKNSRVSLSTGIIILMTGEKSLSVLSVWLPRTATNKFQLVRIVIYQSDKIKLFALTD